MSGPVYLDYTIISDKEQTYGRGGGGYDPLTNFGFNPNMDMKGALADLTRQNMRGRVWGSLEQIQIKLDTFYAAKLKNVSADTDVDLAKVGVSADTRYTSSAEIAEAKSKVDSMVQSKSLALASDAALAKLYSGSDPISLTVAQRRDIVANAVAVPLHKFAEAGRAQQTSYGDSYSAAHNVRVLTASIEILQQRSAALAQQIATAKAAEAEAKAQGDAAEQAVADAYTFSIDVHERKAQLVVAAGTGVIVPGAALTLEAAINSAIQVLRTGASLVMDRATGVGIGLLVYSPSLANGDLYPTSALSIPASSVVPDSSNDLAAIASNRGSIELPFRLYGDRSGYSVVSTQGDGVGSTVAVRAVTLGVDGKSYTFTSAGNPPITLTFPVMEGGNQSTETPGDPPRVPHYHGVTLTPVAGIAQPFPVADELTIKDCIYCFPAASGLPPLYVVFNNPYAGATHTGKHSGRGFNPKNAGGDILNLDWKAANLTPQGIDLVKLHTGRFAASDANKVMIQRLESILRGELEVTDIDRRFYTHELRELERYRAMGIADTDQGEQVWNDTHTAALEDYKINEQVEPLYTREAKEAGDRQDYLDAMRYLK